VAAFVHELGEQRIVRPGDIAELFILPEDLDGPWVMRVSRLPLQAKRVIFSKPLPDIFSLVVLKTRDGDLDGQGLGPFRFRFFPEKINVMQKILLRENKIDRDKEHFWVIGMNIASKILFIELVSLGSVKAATVEPMNVFRMGVMKGAVKLIIVHNHPGDELKPTPNDKDLTDRLIQVGRILDVQVIDHLIITEKSFLSFADSGLLAELLESIKWIPNYELKNKIRDEEEKIRKEAVKTARETGKKEGLKEGEKNKAIAMAKAML
jgi:DNA repair protein RadC